ncbi:hypothetical protein [Stygiobacter electus]|uniref:Outer membrane protein beta-barrel domain-containing protein n=1 Tax=Stygiobacter electus TaxID=3032292 RepID=A0AAE3NZ32_9BACT|nr:hypothetical protein [Stygiobacter electus]MDF1612696.1 hypothetical protein [Stygiobacter electus]
MLKYYLSLAILFILFSNIIYGQMNISKVSLGIGVVNNFQGQSWTDKLNSINYELSIGGKFVLNSFEWDIHLGYTNDGIKEAFNFPEYITYSYSNISFGSRVIFFIKDLENNFPIPLSLILGVSTNFISKKYIGGMRYDESIGQSTSFNYLTYELGTGVTFYKNDVVRIFSNYSMYFLLNVIT